MKNWFYGLSVRWRYMLFLLVVNLVFVLLAWSFDMYLNRDTQNIQECEHKYNQEGQRIKGARNGRNCV